MGDGPKQDTEPLPYRPESIDARHLRPASLRVAALLSGVQWNACQEFKLRQGGCFRANSRGHRSEFFPSRNP